jgi:hypothetical protein
MKAARILQFGSPSVIVDVDIPRLEPRPAQTAGSGQGRRCGAMGRVASGLSPVSPTNDNSHDACSYR